MSRALFRGLGVLLFLADLFSTGWSRAHANGGGYRAPLPGPESFPRAPAMHYANLSPAACRAELRKRSIPHRRVYGGVPGIATPLRLTEPLAGVRFRAPGPKSVFGLLDCRLLLVLSELAPILARHQVVEVRVDNFYRPKARLPGRKKRSQHSYGLAMDVTYFELADGRILEIERDFRGARDEPVCGPEAKVDGNDPSGIALRDLVCAVVRSGLFHDTLTPNYNAAHRDHLHFDIKRGARWISVK